VKLWAAPTWFKRAYRKAFGHCKHTEYGDAITRLNQNHGFTWLDHFGESIAGGSERRIFVSEPYSLNARQLAEIDSLAKAIDCRYEISANSWWYPGRTLRVEFHEKTAQKSGDHAE
jgi:hypothetical protein